MIDVEQAIKWVSLLNAVLWTVLISLWVVGAFRNIHPAEIAGIKLFPDTPILNQTNLASISDVGYAILVALYEVFKWVLLGVTVLLGIESALGLASQILGFIGISIGKGAGQLGKFISRIIQLLLIKVIVDYTIVYLLHSGRPFMFQVEQAFLNSWLGWVTVFFSTAIVAYMLIKDIFVRVEVMLP